MPPRVLDSDTPHPAVATSQLSRTELHSHLHAPPAASSQEGCFADRHGRTQETSIHPCRAESEQDRARRLLEAQRSPLVLTHHSEAFWGNAGLGRNQPSSRARHSSLTWKRTVKAEKLTVLPSQPHSCRSHHMGSAALGYWCSGLGSGHHQPNVLPRTGNPPLFSQPCLNCSICNAQLPRFPSFLYFLLEENDIVLGSAGNQRQLR